MLATSFAVGLAPHDAHADPGAPDEKPTTDQDAKDNKTEAAQKVPIGISNIVIRLEQADEIGLANADTKILLLEHLRARGFAGVGAESLVFDKDESRRAKFRLGAVIRELRCLTRDMGLRCQVGVEWQLLDVAQDTIVYSAMTRVNVLDIPTHDRAKMPAALLKASLDAVLKKEKFLVAITASKAPVSTSPAFDKASVSGCARLSKAMPAGAEEVIQASAFLSTEKGFGSGVFISPEGLLLTAAHVLDGSPLTVKLKNGTQLEGIPIRVSRAADVALVRMSKPLKNQKCLSLATKTTPSLGAELYAIGAPAQKELAFSLTRGIMSGSRDIEGVQVLQTDAPVSPGNSGGPLVDHDGSAVGIVSFKVTGRTVEGVAFAVSAPSALHALALTTDKPTSTSLLAAPQADLGTVTKPKLVQDIPDDSPSLEMLSQGEIDEAERQNITRLANAIPEAEKARKMASMHAVAKSYRTAGLVTGVAGSSFIALGLLANGQASSSSQDDNATAFKVLTGIGVIGAVTGISLYAHGALVDERANKLATTTRWVTPRLTSLSLQPTGVHLGGTF